MTTFIAQDSLTRARSARRRLQKVQTVLLEGPAHQNPVGPELQQFVPRRRIAGPAVPAGPAIRRRGTNCWSSGPTGFWCAGPSRRTVWTFWRRRRAERARVSESWAMKVVMITTDRRRGGILLAFVNYAECI